MDTTLTELPFPPVTKTHILNCSYHSWHPRYRAVTPKSRVIPLSDAFLSYLRADGIILPSNDTPLVRWSDDDSGIFSASDSNDVNESDDDGQGSNNTVDIAAEWRDTHDIIKQTIVDLGGSVVPKLNWSAPKDATWINANSMECRQPGDVYLLLKSSDFITHDLEHPFDDCVDGPGVSLEAKDIPYHLVLRKTVQFNPSVEFRCFVRNRRLIGLCQRDLNHFKFLADMTGQLTSLIQEFFDVRLRDTFPDENFVFDAYVPAPHKKVWLVDINPWAPRTDPLLFSWLELLSMPDPPTDDDGHEDEEDGLNDQTLRLSLRDPSAGHQTSLSQAENYVNKDESHLNEDSSDDESDTDEEIWQPELRLVRATDPEAYSFNTPQYSAHKLPRDVVDASQSGEGLREFARDWQDILAKRQHAEEAEDSDDE